MAAETEFFNQPRRRCPVCLGRVRCTRPQRHIESHWDSTGNAICPASGEPYRISLPPKAASQLEPAA